MRISKIIIRVQPYEWIFQLHRLYVSARPSPVREMAEHICPTRTGVDLPPLGKNWVTKFTKRHPEIKSVMGVRLDKERWNRVTRESMEGWFNLLKYVKEENRILDSNIYNMDEKECILGISEKAWVLIPSSSRVRFFTLEVGRLLGCGLEYFRENSTRLSKTLEDG